MDMIKLVLVCDRKENDVWKTVYGAVKIKIKVKIEIHVLRNVFVLLPVYL